MASVPSAGRGAVAFADAAAARAVHADGMHLVDIGHGAVALGEIADLVHRRDIAVRGIKALKRDQLRSAWIGAVQQFFKVCHIVVAENPLLATRLAHTFDHRVVIERVRQDQAVRHHLRERSNAGLVGDIAGGENQRRFFAVQIGKLALKLDQGMIVAGDGDIFGRWATKVLQHSFE